jgi:hypothetical protein
MSHTDNPNISPQDHPRKFHEVFMLRAAEQGEGMQPRVSAAFVSSFLAELSRGSDRLMRPREGWGMMLELG